LNVDNYGVYYAAKIYLGSQRKMFDVQLDTGSNILVIEDVACTTCQDTFNPANSNTYVSSTVPDSITYGDGSYVKGYKVHDTVSLDSAGNNAVTNFNFLLGMTQKGFAQQDGLIGLSRTVDKSYDMIYDQMYKQGLVSSNVFAFYMAGSSQQSTIEIGSYDTSYFNDPTQYATIPLIGTNLFYEVTVKGFQIGTGASKVQYSTSAASSTAILDTGTTLMMVPQNYYNTLIQGIVAGTRASLSNGAYMDKCINAGSYKSLFLLIGSTWFEIPPSAYLYPVGLGKCMVGI